MLKQDTHKQGKSGVSVECVERILFTREYGWHSWMTDVEMLRAELGASPISIDLPTSTLGVPEVGVDGR